MEPIVMSSAANRFEDGFRRLDSMNAASMDYRQMAALVDSMKKPVLIAKKNVINKLSRRIKTLKEKRKEEESNKNKSQRLIEEIAIIKAIDISRVAKFALANEDTVDNLSRKGRVTPHLLCLMRLSEDKALKAFVEKWRKEHSDWRILANFMLSKNTSRHFKRSEQKRRITKDSLLVEKELMHKRLETQVGSVPVGDVNLPLVERTSKGKKYKKKGREVNMKPSEVEMAEEGDPHVPSDSSDEGLKGDNPEEDDLYTFNIVDQDLDLIEQVGQEVTADQSALVDPKTQLIAKKLFCANDKAASDIESDGNIPEDTKLPNASETDRSISTSKAQTAEEAEKLDNKNMSLDSIVSKKSINNRKPKSKKTSNLYSEDPVQPTKRIKQLSANKSMTVQSEMVKTVLNIEELASQNITAISSDSTDIGTVKNVPRRKKSAFFLGGQIDESLGTNKEEQDRASKNQKTAGYKGMRNSEKKWLTSTFTESLRSNSKPTKRKQTENNPANMEKSQRSSHQSEKYSNKQRMETRTSSKFPSDKKSGAKKFSTKQNQNAESETSVNTLHPSWQASKKRKEQLELIKKGPQGKKITFDD